RQAKLHTLMIARHFDGLIHLAQYTGRYPFTATNHAQTNIFIAQGVALFDHVLLEQVHEKVEFMLRAFPVFARKTVERKLADVQACGLFGGSTNRSDAMTVTFDARQPLALRPTTVAIHDNGDVARAFFQRYVEAVAGRSGG